MNSGILLRFILFFTAISLLLCLIGWTAPYLLKNGRGLA